MEILKKLETLFKEIGFHVRQMDERLIGNFTIGETSAHLAMSAIGSGDNTILNFEVIGLMQPEAVRESQHLGAFLEYLLAQNWRFSAGSVEMDADGEVRVLVELPLADSVVTANQLRMIIHILGQNATELLEKGRRVLVTGSQESNDDDSDDSQLSAPEFMQMLARFVRVAETAGGRAKLLEMKSEPRCPPLIARLIEEALQKAMPDEL